MPVKPVLASTNPFDEDQNFFADAFDDDGAENDDNIEASIESSTYERQLQQQTQDPRVLELRMRAEQVREDTEATQKLENDIENINDIMVDLAQLVHSQHEMVDSIEEQVERSAMQVDQGRSQLQKAVRTKEAKYPFIAAAIGGMALGGPVGVAAGSAIAGIAAAVGGAVAGLWGGRVVVKQKNTQEAENTQ